MKEDISSAQAPKERPAAVVRGKIRNLAFRTQKIWADWMARKTAKMSRRTLYVVLVLFVLSGTIYNSLVLTGHVGSVEVRPGRIEIPTSSTQFKVPKNLNPLEEGVRDLRNVQAYFDSLQRTPEGRVVIDSIAKARPGLLDSINIAEEMMRKH
jgi:hypothetical protein